MTKIYETWIDRIDSGIFTRGQCLQWCHAVLPLSEEFPANGHRTNLEPHEARDLRQRMAKANGVKLTKDHTADGLRWLEKYSARRLTHQTTDEPVLPDGWRNRFDHFRFEGEGINIGSTYRSQYVPCWVIVLDDGREYEYVVSAWQTGNTSYIHERATA